MDPRWARQRRRTMCRETPFVASCCSLINLPRREMAAPFAHALAELSAVVAGVTAANLHTSRRHVFHLLMDVAAVMKLATGTQALGV